MNRQFLTTSDKNHRIRQLLLAATMTVFAATTANAATEHFDFQPGQILKLDFRHGGSISIEGWDQPGIEARFEDDDHGLDRYDVNFESSAEGLTVTARLLDGYRSSDLEFHFKVPRELIVEMETGGGSVELTGLVGDFVGKTGGGALILKDMAGNVDLRTGGGRILVEDSTVDGEVRTGGGRVLIKNVTGDLDARSGGGEVRYVNVVSSDGTVANPNKSKLKDASGGTVMISNAGGKISVDSAPEGADVSTGGGKIRVKNANRFVAAKTGGGDIDLELIEGWVNATTGGGDVDVSVAQNSLGKGDIKVVSGNGDITLTLPADFSMNLLAEVGVTNNTNRSYSVTSDFDIDIAKDSEWDYSRGTPRKFTRGTANLNGGDHEVHIYTTNGNVTIKKLP